MVPTTKWLHPPPSPGVIKVPLFVMYPICPDRGGAQKLISFTYTFWKLLCRMEAKTRSGTFLAKSCGRASDLPPIGPHHPKVPLFLDAAPNQGWIIFCSTYKATCFTEFENLKNPEEWYKECSSMFWKSIHRHIWRQTRWKYK